MVRRAAFWAPMAMTANVLELILVKTRDGLVMPFYRGALSCAEGWPWSIKSRYLGAQIVAANGEVQLVQDLTIGPPVGAGLVSRAYSLLTLMWRVTVSTREVPVAWHDLQSLLLEGLQNNSDAGRDFFYGKAQNLDRLRRCSSAMEFFEVLGLTGAAGDVFEALDRL